MRRWSRRATFWGAFAMVAWSVSRAGVVEVVNLDGADAFARFWRSVFEPDLSAEFVELTIDAAITTAAFAILGSGVALALGGLGALAISERAVGSRRVARSSAAVAALPRSVHEILIALLLVQVLGFEPIVAVIAIGVPFGAVTAKVYADVIDDADRSGYDALRASGAGRVVAIAYGIAPDVRGELVSYAFYRLECAIRSAAVLGIVGVGGLGFQLDVSFESLRYAEIWTLIIALMVLSGAADAASSTVRKRGGVRGTGRILAIGSVVALVWSAWVLDLGVSQLWSARTRERARDFFPDLVPPRLGPGGWSELASATVDTVALAALSTFIAVVFGLIASAMVRRGSVMQSVGVARVATVGRRWFGKVVLLLARAVPTPIWAFLFVLILFPGLWPGAVALGVYNAGVLGRLYAEALEGQPPDSERLAALSGAGAWTRWAYAVLPTGAPRLTSLTVYRAEVIVRETVVIGVVGAGGLGQLIRDHLAARDFAAVTGVVIALAALAIVADAVGTVVRRSLS